MNHELLKYLQQELSFHLKDDFVIQSCQQVFGGDINQTFVVSTNKENFFLKLNSSSTKDMFEKEFNGLQLLYSTNTLLTPYPLLYGEYDRDIFLVMEYVEKGNASKDFWKKFGYELAELHKNTQEHFGLQEDNYIGSISQSNKYCNSWAEFYSTQRIMPLMQEALKQDKCTIADMKKAEQLCHKLPGIFPDEKPSLLHGDLWSGNYMATVTGDPIIFDPAVYYGHREMDIAMSLLFGGFDKSFYHYYNEAHQLEHNWETRIELCQLYPVLVHLLLFGGHYYYSVKEILKKYTCS